MPRAIPIEEEIGKRYGRLTVVEFSHYKELKKGTLKIYKCMCDCGKQCCISRTSLRVGNTKSCGCLQQDMASSSSTKHGLARKCPEYTSWMQMKARCLNAKHKSWPWYGGRGITIANEWIDDFKLFFSYVGPKPSPKHSIDRINNNGNYEPGNVRWATSSAQNSNKRSNRIISFNGKSQTLSQWARDLGINQATLGERIDERGWSIDDALSHGPVCPIKLEHAGQLMTARQWAELKGINYSTLKSRLNSGKWGVSEAIETKCGGVGSNCRASKL